MQGGSLWSLVWPGWDANPWPTTWEADTLATKVRSLTVQPDWLKGRVVCGLLFIQFYLFRPYTESGHEYYIPAPTWNLCVTNSLCDEANREIFLKRIVIAYVLYSGTPFERSPWWEASPSGKATWQCKYKHKCINFYTWWETTPLERPFFWCKRGGLTRGVPLYSIHTGVTLNWGHYMKRKSPPFETLLLKLLMPKKQKGAYVELNCASKCASVWLLWQLLSVHTCNNNNNNNIGWLFFGGYKNILPSMLTILPSPRAIYSCIAPKAIQYYIIIAIFHTHGIILSAISRLHHVDILYSCI